LEEEIIACPSLLVLRQEDGAVRPEKRKSLRYATDSRSWRYKASLPRKNKIALKEVKGKARQVEKIAVEREDGAVRPEKNTAQFCRDETKRELNAKRTNCPSRRRGNFGYLSKRRQSCPPRRKYSPAVPAIFGISEETAYSRLR